MVERYRRSRGKQRLLGNHQKCWVWGRNTVCEILSADRWIPLELRLAESLPDTEIETAVTRARCHAVKLHRSPNSELHSLCHSHEHQGYVAKMPPYPWLGDEHLSELLKNVSGAGLFVVCDRIQDPYNFGAMIRSGDALGVDAFVVGASHQTGVTSLVTRCSAGAVAHAKLINVQDLSGAVSCLRRQDIRVIGTTRDGSQSLHAADFRGPTALVVGNEGVGIDPSLLAQCDSLVHIPQSGHVGSLNASVASGILMYEAARQQATGGQHQHGNPA